MTAAEFHPDPIPHLVFTQPEWDRLKKQEIGAVDGSGIAGQIGRFSGLPVYVDSCPSLWACAKKPDHA